MYYHHHTHDTQVDACVERICTQGCRNVNRIICKLEQGAVVPDAQTLSPAQRTTLLEELKSIMAVYSTAGTCGI